MGSAGRIIEKLWSCTKHEHSLLEGIWAMHYCAVDLGSYNQESICKMLKLRVRLWEDALRPYQFSHIQIPISRMDHVIRIVFSSKDNALPP
jgi:hypothetical protein